ncbi:hypothetical protein NA57DRAFT_72117 [Rhizodiscina lignyota]|uniref:ABM domain-containing protein n=1 Tax=Rhizodiscina lignyota TaxID=1504668 RepID=A0A9P4IPQ2_9PEZI|nr:hypothetical protein NA57DRAFT_72117 [Rhizodiscina lignyota]
MASAFQHPMKPFVIFAQIQTKGEDKIKIELENVGPVVKHESQQPECDSYCFLQPLEGNKSRFTVYEAYDNKEYAMNNHRNSDAFKAFREVVASSDTRQSLDVQAFTPKGGFLWRSEPPKLPLGDQFIWIAFLKATPGKRDELISYALTHAGNVHRTEDETLSFVVLEKDDDKETVVLFERYTSEEYFEKVHKTSETMQQYRANIGPILADRNSEGFAARRGFLDKREAVA